MFIFCLRLVTSMIMYLILLISIVHLAHSDCDLEKPVCNTKPCNVLAEDIISHVNLSVSPFVNPKGFYCSNYKDYDSTELFTEFENMIQNVLEEEYNGPRRVTAVSKLYRSCARADRDEAFHQQVKQYIAEVGGCPLLNRTWNETDFNLEKTVGILMAKHGINTLFKLDFRLHVIQVDKHSEDLKALQNKTRFHRLFQSFSDQVIPSDELDRSFSEVLHFQEGIVKAWQQENDRSSKQRNEQSWPKRSDKFQNSRSNQNISRFNWTTFLNTISEEAGMPLSKETILSDSSKGYEFNQLPKSVQRPLLEDLANQAGLLMDNVTVISVNYNVFAFTELQKFIQRTPKRIIANFLIWKLINLYSVDQLFTNQRQLVNKLDGKSLRSRCTHFVLEWFAEFVEKIIADKRMSANVIEFETIAQIAKAAVNNYIDKLDWLDNETKIKVHKKVKKLKLRVGIDTDFERYPILDHFTGDNFAKDLSIFNLENFKDKFAQLFKDKVYVEYWRKEREEDLIVYSSFTLSYPNYMEHGPLVYNVATFGFLVGQNVLGVILNNANELFTKQTLEKYTALVQSTAIENHLDHRAFQRILEAGVFPELFKAFKAYVDQTGISKSSVRIPGALTNYSISTDFLLSYTNDKCIGYGSFGSDEVANIIVKEYAYDMLKRC